MSTPDFERPGIWRELFPKALALMEHLESVTEDPLWTFGGGTVLMLRLGHRMSKDIDLFVPDPQYLGYVTPRLSEAAKSVSADYLEQAEFVKLFLRNGEIDIVVGTPLTAAPFEIMDYHGREIRVETCAEILAKKMWHRGHRGRARDLFDLCAVAEAEPEALLLAAPYLAAHAAAFLQVLERGGPYVEAEFDAIETLGYQASFSDCMGQARSILMPLVNAQ